MRGLGREWRRGWVKMEARQGKHGAVGMSMTQILLLKFEVSVRGTDYEQCDYIT